VSAVRLVLVLWSGLCLVLAPLLPARDGDRWWQRWLGEQILRTHRVPAALGPETFTAAGAPWVPQEWLLSLGVAIAMRHGAFVLLSLLIAAVPIGVLLSIVARSRGRAEPMAMAVMLLFCGIALSGSFGVRAQVLGWGCFAAFLLFLERRDGWYYASIAAVVVWANVHGSAALAPAFLIARIIGAVADHGLRELKTSRDLRILPFVAVALFCTPLGWHLPVYAAELVTSPIRQYIQEWQPASLSDLGFVFGALPLAMLVVIGWKTVVRDKAEGLPVVMLFVAALFARRNEPLFAIAAAPLAAQALTARFPGVRRLAGRIAGLELFAIAAMCVAFVVTGTAFAWIVQHTPPVVPVAAIARLAASGGQRRVFCENFNDCSLALQYSNVKVFIDGRADPYPLDVWKSYVSAIRIAPGWRDILVRYDVNAVVAPLASPLAQAMARDPIWRTAFRDQTFVLYVRG
jgi:hypothetical protein